jgi:hypothetical protein
VHIHRRAADLLAVIAVSAVLTGCTVDEPPPDEIPPPPEDFEILPSEPPVIDPSPGT